MLSEKAVVIPMRVRIIVMVSPSVPVRPSHGWEYSQRKRRSASKSRWSSACNRCRSPTNMVVNIVATIAPAMKDLRIMVPLSSPRARVLDSPPLDVCILT